MWSSPPLKVFFAHESHEQS
jgi:hypothetical protein